LIRRHFNPLYKKGHLLPFFSKVFHIPYRYCCQVDAAMYISNYQMHNVLKVYTSQLSKKRSPGQSQKADVKPGQDSIGISTEGRRQSVINKVAEDIVARITQGNPHRKAKDQQDMIDQMRDNINRQLDLEEVDRKQFIYNVIGANEEKMTNVLSTADTRALMRRLEELAQGDGDAGKV
jgi:hypothetical protein